MCFRRVLLADKHTDINSLRLRPGNSHDNELAETFLSIQKNVSIGQNCKPACEFISEYIHVYNKRIQIKTKLASD